jgi:hypothetical protein
MFTAEQYRAKAAEFRVFLTNTSRSPNETKEFRDLEQTYTRLAENEEWMAVNLARGFLFGLQRICQQYKKVDHRARASPDSLSAR